jgi:hypothetical protein
MWCEGAASLDHIYRQKSEVALATLEERQDSRLLMRIAHSIQPVTERQIPMLTHSGSVTGGDDFQILGAYGRVAIRGLVMFVPEGF